jgi:hypothetical protein
MYVLRRSFKHGKELHFKGQLNDTQSKNKKEANCYKIIWLLIEQLQVNLNVK